MPARVAIIVTQGFPFPNVSIDARLGDWILRVDSEKVLLAREDGQWAFDLSCFRQEKLKQVLSLLWKQLPDSVCYIAVVGMKIYVVGILKVLL